MGLNIAVFGYSMYAQGQARQGYYGNFEKYYKNMTMSLRDVKNGFWWQPVTSMFAHANLMHIGFNLLTFWSLGGMLCSLPVTPGQFAFLVLGSGLSGSLFWLAQKQMQAQAGYNTPQRALGFSGALMGTTAVLASFLPKNRVALFGVVPVPLWLCVLGYGLYDGYYLDRQNTGIAHAGHLGGLGFGLAYYFLKLRGLRLPGSL